MLNTNTKTEPNIGIEQVQVIPDNAPTISFDIGLGKYYSELGFDYDAFARLADQVGMPDEARRQLTVSMSSKRSVSTSGAYDENENKIHIFRPKKNHDSLNPIFAHEMQHAADKANNSLGQRGRKTLGNLALRGLGAFPIVQAAGIIGMLETADYRYSWAPSIAAIANFAMFRYGYFNHPNEVKARAMEHASQEQVIRHKPKI